MRPFIHIKSWPLQTIVLGQNHSPMELCNPIGEVAQIQPIVETQIVIIDVNVVDVNVTTRSKATKEQAFKDRELRKANNATNQVKEEWLKK